MDERKEWRERKREALECNRNTEHKLKNNYKPEGRGFGKINYGVMLFIENEKHMQFYGLHHPCHTHLSEGGIQSYNSNILEILIGMFLFKKCYGGP